MKRALSYPPFQPSIHLSIYTLTDTTADTDTFCTHNSYTKRNNFYCISLFAIFVDIIFFSIPSKARKI